MGILEKLKEYGVSEEDIEEIKTTADVTVITAIYTLEKTCELLEQSSIPQELKKEILVSFMKKGDK